MGLLGLAWTFLGFPWLACCSGLPGLPCASFVLLERGLNRVTDTCIPEEQAFRRIEGHLLKAWQTASEAGESHAPHQYFYSMLRSGALESEFEADPEASWLLEAAKTELPLFVPGWEDSTMGNIFAARCLEGTIKQECLKGGIDYMVELAKWYEASTSQLAFLQIGGGIAGDYGRGWLWVS